MQAEVAAGLSTLANHSVSGGGTLRNRSVSRRRRYTSHRSQSAHGASNDGDDVMKVIDSSRGTPRPVHRLLVVSTACFLFLCSVLVLSTSLGSVVMMFDFFQSPSVPHVIHCWLDEEHPAKMPSVHLKGSTVHTGRAHPSLHEKESLTLIIFIFRLCVGCRNRPALFPGRMSLLWDNIPYLC